MTLEQLLELVAPGRKAGDKTIPVDAPGMVPLDRLEAIHKELSALRSQAGLLDVAAQTVQGLGVVSSPQQQKVTGAALRLLGRRADVGAFARVPAADLGGTFLMTQSLGQLFLANHGVKNVALRGALAVAREVTSEVDAIDEWIAARLDDPAVPGGRKRVLQIKFGNEELARQRGDDLLKQRRQRKERRKARTDKTIKDAHTAQGRILARQHLAAAPLPEDALQTGKQK